ncbi:MAG: hypothetical protein Q8S26_01930 [Azonexus sp.]|nr:hypothetical protein [Azonexus sp.]
MPSLSLPYPPETKAKGYRFELDYERIIQSDTWALASSRQRPLLLMLWFVSWQQTPCGSLPDSNELIAARLGIELSEFEQNQAILRRGWERAEDGRLYHQVVSEIVLEMLTRKSRDAQRKADYRARMKVHSVPPMSHGTGTGQMRESSGSDDTGTCTGLSKPTPSSASPKASVCEDFAIFWKAYPRKVGKADAAKVFGRLNLSGDLLETIMLGLAAQKASPDWLKEGGKFIPHPAKWLNGRRWEDEAQIAVQKIQQGNPLFVGAV